MKVLLVDDEAMTLTMMEHIVAQNGHDVQVAVDGVEALELLRSERFDVLITDWEMPRLNGIDLCREARRMSAADYTYIIMLTGHDDSSSVVTGLSAGADEFVPKPCTPAELRVRLRTAERILSLQTRNLTIFALAKLAESRDPETGAHLERMREYARLLAYDLSQRRVQPDLYDANFVELIFQTSPLHDIGKVGVPDHVLQKPGKLTNAEFEIMKQHTVIGWETLRAAAEQFPDARFLQMAAEIARSHHERFDGRGYPDGLRCSELPPAAKVVALADVYDALTTKRVYKDAFSHEAARDIILEGRAKHFDPDVVDAFLRQESAFQSIRERLGDGEEAAPGKLVAETLLSISDRG